MARGRPAGRFEGPSGTQRWPLCGTREMAASPRAHSRDLTTLAGSPGSGARPSNGGRIWTPRHRITNVPTRRAPVRHSFVTAAPPGVPRSDALTMDLPGPKSSAARTGSAHGLAPRRFPMAVGRHLALGGCAGFSLTTSTPSRRRGTASKRARTRARRLTNDPICRQTCRAVASPPARIAASHGPPGQCRGRSSGSGGRTARCASSL